MKAIAIGFALAAGLAACVPAEEKPNLPPAAIQAIQKKEFAVGKEIAFASVVSVFQDLGYIVEGADKDTGFITASSPVTDTSSGIDQFLSVFDPEIAELEQSRTKVTAFIESFGDDQTHVRLNFVTSRQTSSAFHDRAEDEPILDAHLYQNAFDKIEDAIFLRQSSR